MSNEVYIVILHDYSEDYPDDMVYVFASREKAWEAINAHGTINPHIKGYTIMDGELVE